MSVEGLGPRALRLRGLDPKHLRTFILLSLLTNRVPEKAASYIWLGVWRGDFLRILERKPFHVLTRNKPYAFPVVGLGHIEPVLVGEALVEEVGSPKEHCSQIRQNPWF